MNGQWNNQVVPWCKLNNSLEPLQVARWWYRRCSGLVACSRSLKAKERSVLPIYCWEQPGPGEFINYVWFLQYRNWVLVGTELRKFGGIITYSKLGFLPRNPLSFFTHLLTNISPVLPASGNLSQIVLASLSINLFDCLGSLMLFFETIENRTTNSLRKIVPRLKLINSFNLVLKKFGIALDFVSSRV